MRFLELRLEGDPVVGVSFAERFTVVSGLEPALRARVREALEGAAAHPARKGPTCVPGATCFVDGARALPAGAPPLVLHGDDIGEPLLDPSQWIADRSEIEALKATKTGLLARRNGLASMVEAPSPHRDAVQAALDAVTSFGADRRIPEADRLVSSIEQLQARLREPWPAAVEPAEIESARSAYERARQHLEDAEAAARGGVSTADAELIDRLHSQLTEAEEHSGRPLGGAGARKRRAEIQKSLDEVLGRLGFTTYSDYLLDTFVAPPDPIHSRKQLDAARRELKLAEPRWRELAEVAELWEARQALEEESRGVSTQAVVLLGSEPAGELTAALRGLHEVAGSLTSTLAEALTTAGVDPSADPVSAGTAWLIQVDHDRLAREAARAREIDGLDQELVAADARIEAAEATIAESERNPGGPLQARLLEILGARRDVRGVGPLPLIVDEALVGATPEMTDLALSLLERMADVQVIFLTGRDEIESWAALRPGVTMRPLSEIVVEEVADEQEAPSPPVPASGTEAVGPTPALSAAPDTRPRVSGPTPGPSTSPAKPAAQKPVAPVKKTGPSTTPKPDMVPAASKSLGRCPCNYELAVGQCQRCRRNFCGDHLVVTTKSALCVACALAVAGVRSADARHRGEGRTRR